jgi:hypothetical protein
MRQVALLAMIASLLGACADPPAPDDGEPRRGGGWDANSGNWNGNFGQWGTVHGIGGNPAWAPNGTGAGTLTNPMLVGLRWIAPLTTGACGPITGGVDRVRFLSSTRSLGDITGPDVELERGGVRARLAMGEGVTFHGDAVDGAMASIMVTIRLRRVDTLAHEAAPSAEWPVFELELCEHARPDRGFTHLGYVSWAPMVRLPESPGEGFGFPAGLVQPVTTLPRAEYRDNPAVPPAVARQTGALLFKFAFYATLPVALDDDPDLAFTTSRGATISNNQVLIRGAIALGNGAWVTMPGDAGLHQFLCFFTRTGTAAAMFALARGDGSGPAELKLPASWGRGAIPALQLTPAELMPTAAPSLDAVHAYAPAGIGAGDVWAHGPSQLGHGASTQRHGYYLGNSANNNRMVFFAQLQASTARARWANVIGGRIVSQGSLDALMRLAGPGPAMLVAAESPPPDGKPPLESPPLGPMPEDSPVFAEPPIIDAAIDADPSTIDAADPDAGVDAMADATTDAADVDAAPPIDAAVTPDAPDLDAPLAIDAGPDALPIDADILIHDAGTLDAPASPLDAPIACAAGCDAAPAL